MNTIFPLVLIVAAAASGPIGPEKQHDEPLSISIIDKRVIESDGTYNSTPAVARAKNGDWVLSYRKGNGPVILRRSHNQGRTWGPEVVYFDTSKPDPTLALTPDGALLIELVKLDPSGIAGAAFSLSHDNGLTWGQFTFFDDPVSNTYAFPTRLFTSDGIMYAASYGPHGDGTDDAELWDSVDSGISWSKRSPIRQPGDAGLTETAIARVGKDRFLAISRDNVNTNTWAHFSDNRGMTWGDQIDYTPQVGVLHLPQLIHAGNALLLLGRQDDPAVYPNELVMYVSLDQGITFTHRTVLDTYTGRAVDGGYCWPLLMENGDVFVVYYADSHDLEQPDIKSLVLRVKRRGRADSE